LEDARQDLDEGALPGAVRTEQGVDLSRLDDEVGRAEGDHGAEALHDVTGFEKGIGHGGRGRVCRGGPQAAPARCSLYGPLQPKSWPEEYVVHGLICSRALYVGARLGE